jgi:MFS superfamily sulfate permease-like transporter
VLNVDESKSGNKHVKMILAEEVYFLNKGAIANELNKLPEGSTVTIDASRSVSIDHDVREVINDFKKNAKTKNIQVNVILEPAVKNGNGNSHSVKSEPIKV